MHMLEEMKVNRQIA